MRPMDASQDECRRCDLRRHMVEDRVPAGCQVAWSLHHRLGGPAVERMGLQSLVLEALGINWTPGQWLDMIDKLEQIESGTMDAQRELQARERAKLREAAIRDAAARGRR